LNGVLTLTENIADLGGTNIAYDALQLYLKDHPEKNVKFDEQLEPLSKFILPGDSKTSSFLHLGRTIVRRAERDLWKLGETEEIHMSNLRYLNRLSDLLFILARVEDEVK